MADVIYKKGQSANLDNVEIADGQILVTEDTGEMYIDMSDGTRKKISDNNKQDKFGEYDPDESVITASSDILTLKDSVNKSQLVLTSFGPVLAANDGSVSITSNSTTDDNGTAFSVHESHLQIDCPESGRPIWGVTTLTEPDATLGGGRFATEELLGLQATSKSYVDNQINNLDSKVNNLASTKLKREIVAELPSIAEGTENTIYMVGPKDDGTYDEYMKVQNGIVSESVSNVGTRHNIQPSLINFEQENGYYIIPDVTCVSVTGGVGNFNGNGVSVAFGFDTNEEGTKFTEFCQPNEIYTLKIKVGSISGNIPNITEIKACKTGPSYELIGNTSVDLSTKQDKFAEYDLAHNCWVPDNIFKLGSNDNSYLLLSQNTATIGGKTNAQLSIERGTIGLSELTQNNSSILTLTMNGTSRIRRITGVTSVENAYDVANKNYVDNEIVKSKYEILQTAIVGTDITQTNGPMISGIYTVTTISNGAIGVKAPNGNTWTLNVQNTNLNFSKNDQLLITTLNGAIVGEIITIKEIKKQDKLQLIEEYVPRNTVKLTGSIETIEQRTQSNCEYKGGNGLSTGTEYTVVDMSISATSATIYINQSRAGFNFKYSGMLHMSIGDTFTLEKVDGTTGTLIMNDKINIHINHKITQSTDVTILGVKTPTADSSGTVAANKEYVDALITRIQKLENAIIALGGTIEE